MAVFKASTGSGTGGVAASLQLVRQLASAPCRLRDPTLILAALQTLADEARCLNDPKAAEYEAILRQTRPHMLKPEFGEIIIRLLGTKEEISVASTIAKMVKDTPQTAPYLQAQYQPAPYQQQAFYQQPSFQPYPTPYRGRGRGRAGNLTCFSCGRPGHFQRHCPDFKS